MEAVAKLYNYPTSPRKMRLLADLIRGLEVEKALGILQFNPKHPAVPMYKLLKSAINNWEQKNSSEKVEDAGLIVKTVMVDGGRAIKRMRPAPQGRGYRIRKRSNHITIIVDSRHLQNVTFPGKGESTVEESVSDLHTGENVEVKEEKKLAEVKKAKVEKVAKKSPAKKATSGKEIPAAESAKKEQSAPEKAEKKSTAKKPKK
jgi:large subunit ribosomal protein L22